MNELNKLKNLFAGHAYWAKKKQELKAAGSIESSKCTLLELSSQHMLETCIEKAHILMTSHNQGEHYSDECITFDDVFVEDVEFEPCSHCVEVRALKRKRMKAGKRLGHIRSAISRIGSRLHYTDNLNKTVHKPMKVKIAEIIDFDDTYPF